MKRLALPLVLLAALAVTVAGCGSSSSKSKTTSTAAKTTSTQASDFTAKLEITVSNVGAEGSVIEPPGNMACTRSIPATCHMTLSCPAAQDDAAAVEACARLESGYGKTLLTPASAEKHQACTMQYGGPETATITGTVNGEPVAVKLDRGDGCAIARYDAHAVLWADASQS